MTAATTAKSDLNSLASLETSLAGEEYALATPLVVSSSSSSSQHHVDESLYVDKPVRTLDAKYLSLANLRQELKWTDTFFDDEDDGDVIAVFDFDYDKMESFYTSIGWATLASTCLYTPIFVASVVLGVPCYLNQNVQWSTRSKHVAITQDGIRFVQERRPTCWGLPCSDKGKSSKTVPFDKITDCDIEEPAGNSCLCVLNILSTVNVDTASSGTEGKKELKLAGLKDPHSFKKLVWAMKRSQQQQQQQQQQHHGFGVGSSAHAAADAASAAANSMVMADYGGSGSGSGSGASEEVSSLLREIRDELRVNNQLLQTPLPQQAEQSSLLL